MKKNMSEIFQTGPGNQVVGRGLNSPVYSQKLEGFDKAKTAESFTFKIEKLKSKPKKQILEDMYVKGLQDEIHYLQMELKLLKEKEVAKHSQVDQLQTFFGDGIPINENILAMKNGFNNYQQDIGKKIDTLAFEKKEREGLIQSLSSKVADMTKEIHEKQKEFKQSLTSKSDILHEKVKNEAGLKHQIKVQDENLRMIKYENKKLQESIGVMQRARQILLVSMLKVGNNKFTRLNKLKETITDKEKELAEVCKSFEELKKQEDEKVYVIKVEEDNLKSKKKVISLEKELNGLKTKIEEKKMELEGKLKDRHKQILARSQIQLRLDNLKESIDRQNSMNLSDLEKMAIEKQAASLQTIIEKNRKISKYIEYYGNLQAKVQDNLHSMVEKKPDLKRELQLERGISTSLTKECELQKKRQYELISEIEKFKSKSTHIHEIVPGTLQASKKQHQKIKLHKSQRERLIDEIQVKEKQLELIEMLKTLTLEEAQISSSSNSSIQERLIEFMRGWETLNRA